MAPSHASPDANPLTRSYSEPFPIPNQHQFQTINQVISALPDGTDSWQPLDETCHSLGVDESLLPLFLKLGLERGKDWNQKWTNAKQSLAQRGYNVKGKVVMAAVEVESVDSGGGGGVRGGRAGGFEVLKAKVDQVNRRERTRQQQPQTHFESNHYHQPPSRSPRFTSANAVAGPSSAPARDFLVQPKTDYNSSSDDYAGVPSRTLPSRTQPRPTTFAASARQSTTPLVDSAISARAANPTVATSAHPATTSPALINFINSRTPRQQHSFYAAPPVEPTLAPSQSSRLHSALEARADDFRRLSLLSQSWHAWHATLLHLHARQAHLDQARRAVLLRWALLKWRARTAQLHELDQVGREVQHAREKDLMRRTVVEWVGAMDRKRRREWEEGLRVAWDGVRVRWKERLVREAFARWQGVAMERRAIRFRQDKLVAGALARWRGRRGQIASIAAGAVTYDRQMTQHKVLDSWRYLARLLQVERGFVRTREEVLLGGLLERWRDRT